MYKLIQKNTGCVHAGFDSHRTACGRYTDNMECVEIEHKSKITCTKCLEIMIRHYNSIHDKSYSMFVQFNEHRHSHKQ